MTSGMHCSLKTAQRNSKELQFHYKLREYAFSLPERLFFPDGLFKQSVKSGLFNSPGRLLEVILWKPAKPGFQKQANREARGSAHRRRIEYTSRRQVPAATKRCAAYGSPQTQTVQKQAGLGARGSAHRRRIEYTSRRQVPAATTPCAAYQRFA